MAKLHCGKACSILFIDSQMPKRCVDAVEMVQLPEAIDVSAKICSSFVFAHTMLKSSCADFFMHGSLRIKDSTRSVSYPSLF